MNDDLIKKPKEEVKPLPPLRKANKEGKVTVFLHRKEDDPETHPVCHNGIWYHVPMGEDHDVPEHVYHILHNARKCR